MNETHHEPTESEPQPKAAEHRETDPKPSPAIYVASLADYNNGVLHGKWIDAAREPEAIQADINDILDSSREPNAEEWAIHDYEQFGRWRVNEYDSLEQVSRIARGIAEHGYAYAAWADVFDGEEASCDIDSFHEAYLGHYDSVTDYVEQMADDLGYEQQLDTLPEHLRDYVRIDYAAIARDLHLSGDIATVDDPNGGLWIFRTNH
ncbi:antirestriction protein [Mycolicibacterium agri]|uniref:Antirestriction protein n=2 Tax=Mycolicibacterium agri TaxID=36811 RepID=A0A2A7MSP6_MYCAG|nr:antirestriction protein [Mycolicibacterium agri]GFG50804.1 antirestriction protein ArdA [Mycolicibacterium agri]